MQSDRDGTNTHHHPLASPCTICKTELVTPSPRPNLSNFATVWLLSTFSPQPLRADCVGNKQPQPSPWLAIVIERWKRRRAEKNTRQIPVCGAYGALCPNLSPINFLGPSFFRNKFPFPQKGTTPRRTWYTKNIQNQFWDRGGKHLWIKFQWPRCCLSLCKSPTNTAPRNSTLFFGCNPSVAEYFSMGQPPWTLKIPKLGLNKFPRGIIFSGTGLGKNPTRTNPVTTMEGIAKKSREE